MNQDGYENMEKKELVEMIPSKWMREYLKGKKDFKDREKATLIWNAPNVTWENRVASLNVLAERTRDIVLKEQLKERIEYEKKSYVRFLQTCHQEYVYVVLDSEEKSCGYFADAHMAEQYGIKYAREWHEKNFEIEKHMIVSMNNLNKIPKEWHSKGEMSDYTGVAASCVRYNSAGDILNIYSNEMSDEEKERVDKLDRVRFENSFIKIPCGMKAGTVVKILDELHLGEFGVLEDGEEWMEYMNTSIRQPEYYDFSDIQTVVYILNNDGTWTHAHINPLYLEVQMPEVEEGYINSETYKEAICAMGEFIKNPSEENNHKALTASRNYAKAWGNESKTWGVYNVEELIV